MADLSFFPEDLSAAAWSARANEALKSWDIGRVRAVRFVGMRENCIFAVEADGNRFALRLHRPGYHARAGVESELAWMEALPRFGAGCPQVQRTIRNERTSGIEASGAGQQIVTSLVEWVPGEPLSETSDIRFAFRRLGDLTARLHAHAAAWRQPAWFERPHWDANGLIGERPVWGAFDNNPTLTDDGLAILGDVRASVHDRLNALGKDKTVYGLIHADMLPENVLVDDRQVRIIDFDDCGSAIGCTTLHLR